MLSKYLPIKFMEAGLQNRADTSLSSAHPTLLRAQLSHFERQVVASPRNSTHLRGEETKIVGREERREE